MSQPIIGISGNHYKTGDHTEPLLSYTQTCLVNAIEDAGGIPLFGICRGLQLFNVGQGGSLHQEVLGHWQENTGNQPSQDLYFPIESQLSQIYAQEPTVNSFHRQAINKLASSLEIIALSPDKQTIEAVQSTRDSHTFLGVQWHPELLYGERETENRLFDYIVNQF